jgi:hypothetical protein
MEKELSHTYGREQQGFLPRCTAFGRELPERKSTRDQEVCQMVRQPFFTCVLLVAWCSARYTSKLQTQVWTISDLLRMLCASGTEST